MFAKTSFFLFLSLCVFSQNLLAQKISKKEIKTLEAEADQYFTNSRFQDALPLYLKLDSLKPNNPTTNVKIGKCYLGSDFGYKCLPYFEKAKSLKYSFEPLDYFIARAYHLNHRFDTAMVLYQVAKKAEAGNKENLQSIDHYIQNCNNGIELSKNPVKVKIENLGPNINTSGPEYAPVISGNENTLIFTSSRPDSYGGLLDEFGHHYEDVYISQYENGAWTKPVNPGSPINTSYNDATISLSVDGQQLFVYQNDEKTGSGDIYISNLIDNAWTKPEKMSANINSQYWEPGASMIADENTFFFSSNKPGGIGGTDIYVCKRDTNGIWGVPENLGPNVNTSFDEDAPFIHPDSKTLYFSSTGHNSIGGYDVFTVQYFREKDSVGIAENIGYPINTADDELFFVWSADGTRGYFSASREDGYGDRDIYMLTRPSIDMNLILLSGQIKTSENNKIPAKIYVIDNSTNKVVAYYDSTKFSGQYTITLEPGKNYAVSIESDQYLSHSENIYVPVNGFYELKKDIVLHTIDEGGLIILNNVFFDQGSTELKPESYGELDRYFTTLQSNPDIFVEIASHAFDYNDHKANAELSQKRAEAVVDYLVKKGINADKLRAVGYGDRFKIDDDDSEEARNINTRTELIIIDKLKEGEKRKVSSGYYNDRMKQGVAQVGQNSKEFMPVEITREGVNRNEKPKEKYLIEKEKDIYVAENFSQLKQVKEIREQVASGTLKPVLVKGKVIEGGTTNTLAAKVQLLDANGNMVAETMANEDGFYELVAYNSIEKKHSIAVHKPGYKYDSKDFTLPANGTVKAEVFRDLALYKLEVGSIFQLRNIYFNYNNTTLRNESFPELNKLVKLMKQNTNLNIEIAGHTDSDGSSLYNKKLSQGRCESVMKYLVKNGISASRVKAVGYGEGKPLASNDDELEGKEINRRIEFEVLK